MFGRGDSAFFGVTDIDPGRSEAGTHAHLLGGGNDLFGDEVAVVEEDRAAFDHLQAGEAGSCIDVLRREFCLGGPDVFVEPREELQIVRIAAQQYHRHMGVAVVERREGEHSVGVELLVEGAIQVRGDGGKTIAFDGNIYHLVI